MGEKNPMGFFSYFERFIHETFRNIIFYKMMNNYDILMRLVVFKKNKKSHGIFSTRGFFPPWDFFPMGFFSVVSRISFLMRKTTIKEIIIIILNNKLNNINNMNIFKMSYN